MADRPRQLSTPVKLPKLRANVIRPRGPESIHIKEQFIGGYGDPPPGFIGGQNSITEWIVYWALFKVLDPTANPRKPPFFGLPGKFDYQSPQMAGFVRALGSAVVDFLIRQGGTFIALRIQTEFFHIFTDERKHAYDMVQRANLMKKIRVIDLYDNELLGDPSGAKAIVAVKRALNMIESLNPILSGNAIRGSRLKVIQ